MMIIDSSEFLEKSEHGLPGEPTGALECRKSWSGESECDLRTLADDGVSIDFAETVDMGLTGA